MTGITDYFNTNQKSLGKFFDFFQLIQNNDIILIYSGEFSQEMTKTLLAFAERKLSSEKLEDLVRKKIFNIMVEMLQNMSKYAINNHPVININSPVFMIGESSEYFFLISSNQISNEKIQNLKNRLDEINTLNPEGLKALYKQIRLNSTFSVQGGAGIGMIDIARKSENKLTYCFSDIDTSVSMFSLLIKVTKNLNN